MFGWLIAFAFLSPNAHAENFLTTSTPSSRPASALAYRELPDPAGEHRQTLVLDSKIPASTQVRIDLDQPLLYQWVQNAQGKVVPSSIPYYAGQVLSLPNEASATDRAHLLGATFYFSVYDLSPSRVVSSTFSAELPANGHKPILPLPWDAFNPKGTWGYAIEQALTRDDNAFLLDSPPADIKDFCPHYGALDRAHKVHFWQAFMSQVSDLESSNLPYCASDEGVYNPAAKGVISSGLVQISLLSVKAACYQSRGCTEIGEQADLFDPAKNLHCGLAVMSCLATRGQCISCQGADGSWNGIAAYWSTLRDPHDVPCSTCPSGHVRVGYKPDIEAAMKTSAAYCF